MDSLVSCILPTYNRRSFFAQALDYFRRQDYPERELIVVDDGIDAVGDLVAGDPAIRYIRLEQRMTVGAKRNLACRNARGEIVLHWDDDDWMADWRVSCQVRRLLESRADICGLDHLKYYEPASGKGWEYVYPAGARRWVAGNTLCYRRLFWERHPFPEIDVAEDVRFVWQAEPERILRLEDGDFIVGTIHAGNVSPKVTIGSCWRSIDPATLPSRRRGEIGRTALVAAARGIGDVLRVTPLVRMLHLQGYAVDLFLQPDYPETADLLRGAPEVREVYTQTPSGASYDVAIFSLWAAAAAAVSARRKLHFERHDWIPRGDTFCVEKIARELGWRDPLPPPFAVPSSRRFDLPPASVALHVGCKPDWPWKKWHGFDELAELLPDVVLVGTPSDLDNAGTYFARNFRWPAHVRDFVGKLSLKDTAAVLKQCAALVSNDSGMMHLGAALGIPTLGIFGITSPEREGVAAKNLFPVTKGLPCEPACRRQPWGRRDCEHHLRCLKELTAADVKARLKEVIDMRDTAKLKVAYYGHVFDSSGYGNAARGYIHAFHAAGADLSVIDLSPHERQVRDELVEELVGRPIDPDFHLFHGIPHVWARHGFRVRNAIAMTVWETDTMPTQWRNTLNHALETWLPCDFNVAAFQGQVARVAKLPHPIIPRNGHEPLPDPRDFLRVEPDEFVVYSIFEWQDRKCPVQQMRAFLNSFQARDRVVLVLKTNPDAAQIAAGALETVRAETGSDARIELRPEAWSEAQIEALHASGNCYLSLHRGEGWCYPLFEAACKGIPVVATAYSGPLEYLDADHHQLVPYRLTAVRQPYVYYHSRMQWAEPDVGAAAERLRWVYEHRDEAAHKAAVAAVALNRRYAPEAIGAVALRRMLDLLRQTNRPRYHTLRGNEADIASAPAAPIDGSWYDGEYFETGVKSNWTGGYGWPQFERLFRDAAAWLAAMFPVADSFLDAGCAKGFLVRALRETGKNACGFDASAWAVSHAADEVRRFLQLAGVDNYAFDEPVDVLCSFDLFAHLTEEQIRGFLRRARPHVRVALVAVIATYDSPDARQAGDRDLSHITRQTREWWDAHFLETGWRKDSLHRNLERLCQQHELPRRMGWAVYVYSPG